MFEVTPLGFSSPPSRGFEAHPDWISKPTTRKKMCRLGAPTHLPNASRVERLAAMDAVRVFRRGDSSGEGGVCMSGADDEKGGNCADDDQQGEVL